MSLSCYLRQNGLYRILTNLTEGVFPKSFWAFLFQSQIIEFQSQMKFNIIELLWKWETLVVWSENTSNWRGTFWFNYDNMKVQSSAKILNFLTIFTQIRYLEALLSYKLRLLITENK